MFIVIFRDVIGRIIWFCGCQFRLTVEQSIKSDKLAGKRGTKNRHNYPLIKRVCCASDFSEAVLKVWPNMAPLTDMGAGI